MEGDREGKTDMGRGKEQVRASEREKEGWGTITFGTSSG